MKIWKILINDWSWLCYPVECIVLWYAGLQNATAVGIQKLLRLHAAIVAVIWEICLDKKVCETSWNSKNNGKIDTVLYVSGRWKPSNSFEKGIWDCVTLWPPKVIFQPTTIFTAAKQWCKCLRLSQASESFIFWREEPAHPFSWHNSEGQQQGNPKS